MKKLLFILMIIFSINLYSQNIIVYEKKNITNDTIKVEEVTVTGSYTAVKETPFSFTNLDRTAINSRQFGTEPAILLSGTPSVIYYSDNGTGYGYIYYRLRGIDQTRINSTFNGVPMNEPEDQGIYYNNFGNFLSVVDHIQIIRGAGMTKSGISSYGGSINFNSIKFSDEFSLNASVSKGSYNTSQVTGGVSTKNFFISATGQSTDGYKDHTFNKSYSTFYGVKFKDFNLYGFVGNQKNGMGWIGEPMDSINIDPRYNSNTKDETDDFTYVHNQIHWNKSGFKAIVYHTYLYGWYDTDIAHFDHSLQWGDLINRIKLSSNWLGTILNYNLKLKNINTNYGISAYTYYRDHVGLYNEIETYTNTGYRNEIAPYAKGEITNEYVSMYGDIQYRYSTFSYDGLRSFDTQTYKFFNWSGGITIRTGTYSNVYYGIGRTNREPTRTDLFSGCDDFDLTYYNPTIPETVLDQELGFKHNKNSLNLNVNLYYMDFQNEIVLNGKMGPNSILLHQNVDNSFRSGLEFDGNYKFYNGFEFILVGNISHNRIKEDGEIFEPILTPSVILSGDVKYNLKDWFYVGLNIGYSGESYIDFANDEPFSSTTILNAYSGLKIKKIELQINLNNLSNELIIGNAIMGDSEPLYFVMSDITGLLTLKYKF